MEVPFYEVEDLTIERENNLETLLLWHNNVLTSNSFCKLQNICIGQCNKLTYVFPSHMIPSLVFLNTLKVSNCELLERIFEIEELTVRDVKVVPLTKLSLDRLPNLKYIWKKDPGELLRFPNLKEVDVAGCPQLKSVFPASFIKYMEEIESLSANGENQIFAEDEASKVVFPESALFPSLRNLAIHKKVVEKGRFWVRSEERFPKLESLCLFGSEGEEGGMLSLPLEMSEVLCRIEELKIEKAFELVQVFQNKQSGGKLKRLYLYDLPKLTHVWEAAVEAEVEIEAETRTSLERIEMCECDSLKCILPSSITFLNLTYLEVSYCDGMMNLFSSSVAKNVVNLERMKIMGCEGMSSIVIVEEEEIIFKKLNCLKLYDLPRLVSFQYSENEKWCRLKFPCLEELSIKRCPEIKTFSYGRIDTPILTFLTTEEGDIPVSEAYGINDIIQAFFPHQGKEESEEDNEEDIEEDIED